MSEEQELGFKVSDRRLFNADGSLRDDLVEMESPAQTEPVAPSIAAIDSPSSDSIPPANVAGVDEISAPTSSEDGEAEMTEFIQFLYSLASSTTFIHLGLMEHPATGKPEVDLEAAQEGIGLLILLREKTKGNLNRSEEEFFENLLADLKMQFVSLRG